MSSTRPFPSSSAPPPAPTSCAKPPLSYYTDCPVGRRHRRHRRLLLLPLRNHGHQRSRQWHWPSYPTRVGLPWRGCGECRDEKSRGWRKAVDWRRWDWCCLLGREGPTNPMGLLHVGFHSTAFGQTEEYCRPRQFGDVPMWHNLPRHFRDDPLSAKEDGRMVRHGLGSGGQRGMGRGGWATF